MILIQEIINFIIPYFDTNNIKYKILSKDEIDGLIRKIRIYYESIENINEQIENIKLKQFNGTETANRRDILHTKFSNIENAKSIISEIFN